MAPKAKPTVSTHVQEDYPVSDVPHWEPGHPSAFHKTSTIEEWNQKWVEGHRIRSMDEVIRKLTMLIGIAAAVGIVNAAVLILLVAHAST